MSAAKERSTAEIVELGDARAQRSAANPTLDNAGAMLRAAREDAGYTIGDVSDEINVKPERLAAIEAMRFEGLPGAPYTLGFVRAYAGFLDLPVEPLVARFREEAGWTKAVTAPKIAAPKRLKADREFGLVGILIVAAFAIWAVWQFVGRTPPEEDGVLPSGYPIADRTETPQVVSEVTTDLENDLTVTPPVRVEENDVPVAERGEAAAATAGTPARPSTSSGAADDRFPPIVPLVLASPLAGSPEPESVVVLPRAPVQAEAELEPGPIETATEEDPALARPDADALNERLLREVMAASEPGRATDRESAATEADPDSEPTVAAELSAAEPGSLIRARPAPMSEPVTESPSVAAVPEARPESRVAAELTDPVSPVYPRRCQRLADEEEVVTVRYNVSRLGRVTSPDIASSTNSCFDNAALSAVSRFGFEPATESGRAVVENGRTTRLVFRRP